MIEINLLPGAGKKAQRKSGGGVNIGAAIAGIIASVKDPWLIGAVLALGGSSALIAVLYTYQTARAASLTRQEQKAVQDSTRFAAVLKQKALAEAQRDSVLTQLNVIKSIDNNRFVWPHLMEEVSKSLPPYTWLTVMAQTSVSTSAAAAPADAPAPKAKGHAAPPPVPRDTVRFRIVGNTVDIQALTRFMRLLEQSPFIENVQLARSTLVIVEGKEVTEFQLEAQYEQPDSSAIRTVPVALSVR